MYSFVCIYILLNEEMTPLEDALMRLVCVSLCSHQIVTQYVKYVKSNTNKNIPKTYDVGLLWDEPTNLSVDL